MHSNGTATKPTTFDGTLSASEIMPHSEEAETAVLGSVLIDPDAFYDVDLIVSPDDFYSLQRGKVYQAMRDLYAAKTPVDVLTITETLTRRGVERIANEPTESYVIGLLSAVPSSINAASYARIVEADAMRRRLIRAGDKIKNEALKTGVNISALVEASERELFAVTQKSATKNVIPIRQGMSQLIDVTMQRASGEVDAAGIMSGWLDFDRLLGGFKPGRTYVIAGRPGMGKSMAENCIALQAAKNGKRVARFNLEMDLESITMRSVAAHSGIPFANIEKGQFSAGEYDKFNHAAGELSLLPMWIDDTAGLSMSQLAAKARRIKAEYGLDMLTIDYLTLMRIENPSGNRAQDVGQISRRIKELAKDLHIPIIALAQLSRQCEQRSDKRPLLSDLRDSGEIEQDADAVAFLYRDEHYSPDTTERPNIVEVNLAKHRHGPTGQIDLYFSGSTMRLLNLSRNTMNL